MNSHPVPLRGTLRERHGTSGRDAVDAAARETGVLSLRTAKSCGPDTSVLVSSLRSVPQVTVARKPIAGEGTYKP